MGAVADGGRRDRDGGRAGVFIAAIATDRIDGDIARARNLVTDFGKIMDPIADKALTGMAFIGLSIIGELWWWVTILVLLREWGVTLMRLSVLKKVVIAAADLGKLKTTYPGDRARDPVPAAAAGPRPPELDGGAWGEVLFYLAQGCPGDRGRRSLSGPVTSSSAASGSSAPACVPDFQARQGMRAVAAVPEIALVASSASVTITVKKKSNRQAEDLALASGRPRSAPTCYAARPESLPSRYKMLGRSTCLRRSFQG